MPERRPLDCRVRGKKSALTIRCEHRERNKEMPTPDQIARNHRPPFDIDEMFRRMPETKDSLASEIAKLRDEIAALRAELAPAPSLIVTGRQALDEFKRLAHAGP